MTERGVLRPAIRKAKQIIEQQDQMTLEALRSSALQELIRLQQAVLEITWETIE